VSPYVNYGGEFACPNVYLWLVGSNATNSTAIRLDGVGFQGLVATTGCASCGSTPVSGGSIAFNNNSNLVSVPNVILGGSAVSIGTWVFIETCGPSSLQATPLITHQSMNISFFDNGYYPYNYTNSSYGGCELLVDWSSKSGNKYHYASKNLKIQYYTWQYLWVTITQTGQLKFGVGVPGDPLMTFEMRANSSQYFGTDTFGFLSQGGPHISTQSTLWIGSPDALANGFIGAVAELQVFLNDESAYADANFFANPAACAPKGTVWEPSYFVFGGTTSGGDFNGSISDVQYYNTELSYATTQSLVQGVSPAGCNVNFSPPPPRPPPPSPFPPPPSTPPVSPPPTKSPPPSPLPPPTPPPPRPPPRFAPPAVLEMPTVISLTGCPTTPGLVVPCGNYTVFPFTIGSQCPYTNLNGMVAAPQPGNQIFILDAGVIYRSQFIHNPYDLTGASDYTFWMYSVYDGTNYTSIIGTSPCAPMNNVYPGTNLYTTRYYSTSFDTLPQTERFSGFTAYTPFGSGVLSNLAVEYVVY
jgi:hypothetical protein